eukprot:364661-Chlamydomonas_euryale.AAC.2
MGDADTIRSFDLPGRCWRHGVSIKIVSDGARGLHALWAPRSPRWPTPGLTGRSILPVASQLPADKGPPPCTCAACRCGPSRRRSTRSSTALTSAWTRAQS